MTTHTCKWLFVTLLFVSCAEDEITVPDYTPPESDRVILIEEFTGASCSGCPAGATAIDELLSTFPDNIVAVAVHSNHLGWPAKPGDLDLRNQDANDIESFLGEWRAKPEASFNRKVFSDRGENHIRVRTLPAAWINYVEDELKTYSRVTMEVETEYDATIREVSMKVIVTANEIMSGDFRVNVLLTEDDIVTAQKDQTSTIEKFKQKHVLRKLLTDVAGETLFTSLGSGQTREYFSSFTLPDEEDMGWWIPENMHVVAFLTDGDSKEVLQAVQSPVNR